MRLSRSFPSWLLAVTLAGCAAGGASSRPEPRHPGEWVRQENSFGWLAGFRIRVDVHTRSERLAANLSDSIRLQIERTLKRNHIELAEPSDAPPPRLDGTGDIIVDVHLVDTEKGTAVSWSLHASQPVRLGNGAWTFGSTWEVGDLLFPPTFATVVALRDSLQPALEEFCKRWLEARPAPDGAKGEESEKGDKQPAPAATDL